MKMTNSPAQRGMFFEEFQVGQQIVTAGRTITEADIVHYAGLSGDYNQIHTDAEFASRSVFGQRVAHGLLQSVRFMTESGIGPNLLWYYF
jgi:acyl dehydratase